MLEYSGAENLEAMTEAVNYNAFLVALIRDELRTGETIVDFGAGIGTFALAVAGHDRTVHCIEPDRRQLARILESGLPGSVDLEAVEDGSVDVLYSFNVLEHIDDDLAALRLCLRKLKPGGRLLIYVPAFELLYSSMDRMVGHFRRYTRKALGEKVCAAGFSVLRSEYVDSAWFFASLAFKYFGNDQGRINREALIAYDRFVFPVSRLADAVLSRLFGKNVFMVARRPPPSACT